DPAVDERRRGPVRGRLTPLRSGTRAPKVSRDETVHGGSCGTPTILVRGSRHAPRKARPLPGGSDRPAVACGADPAGRPTRPWDEPGDAAMTIRTTPLALEDLHRLDRHWREFPYLEFDPSRGDTVDDPAMAKEAWITGLLIEWGSCGRLVWQGDGLPRVRPCAPHGD